MKPPSVLEPVPCPEDPGDDAEAQEQECAGHDEADADSDIGAFIEAPAEPADQVNDGIEQADRAPWLWQDVDRVEAAAQKRQRCHDEQWNDLQLLEAVGPNPDDEPEQAEGHRSQYQKAQHPYGMSDLE